MSHYHVVRMIKTAKSQYLLYWAPPMAGEGHGLLTGCNYRRRRRRHSLLLLRPLPASLTLAVSPLRRLCRRISLRPYGQLQYHLRAIHGLLLLRRSVNLIHRLSVVRVLEYPCIRQGKAHIPATKIGVPFRIGHHVLQKHKPALVNDVVVFGRDAIGEKALRVARIGSPFLHAQQSHKRDRRLFPPFLRVQVGVDCTQHHPRCPCSAVSGIVCVGVSAVKCRVQSADPLLHRRDDAPMAGERAHLDRVIWHPSCW